MRYKYANGPSSGCHQFTCSKQYISKVKWPIEIIFHVKQNQVQRKATDGFLASWIETLIVMKTIDLQLSPLESKLTTQQGPLAHID